MLPTVALIGRPNVGKSTLFNRLIGMNRALTHDRPGVTRDRMYGKSRRGQEPYRVVDTGGIAMDADGAVMEGPDGLKGFESEVLDQAKLAVTEAQILLLVLDAREGLNPLDQELARFLRGSSKPVLALVNKVDGEEQENMLAGEFYSLGLEMLPVSASHGYNFHGLLDRLDELVRAVDPGELPQEEISKPLRLAMLGRPNAGKSSIINALLGEKRLIVSDLPGTTRDSVDVAVRDAKDPEKHYVFVDTAGVRKRAKVQDQVEQLSVQAALKSSRKADVTVLVLDATQGFSTQDKKLLALLDKDKIPFLVVINKIDLVPKGMLGECKKDFEHALRICPHVPVLYTSAVKYRGLDKILPTAEALWEECGVRVSTGLLNRALQAATKKHQAPVVKRVRAKFYYLTQPSTHPPTFVFFVNDPERIKESYVRYLEKQLRKSFAITMAPMKVHFRSSHGKDR